MPDNFSGLSTLEMEVEAGPQPGLDGARTGHPPRPDDSPRLPVTEVEAGTEPRPAHDLSELAPKMLSALFRLERVGAHIIDEEAEILFLLKQRQAFRILGFSTMGDMAAEALRMSPRTALSRIELHELFRRLPAARDAFLAGRISACKLLAMKPMLTPENVDAWMRKSRLYSVRALKRKVRQLSEQGAIAPAHEDPEHGRTISFTAPPEVALAWEESLEMARRVLGRDAPRYRCVEAILAEAAPEAGSTHSSSGAAGPTSSSKSAGEAGFTRSSRPKRMSWTSILPPPPMSLNLSGDPSVPGCPAGMDQARRTLRLISEKLDVLHRDRRDPLYLTPHELLARLVKLEGLGRPLQVFTGRLLLDFRESNALRYYGFVHQTDFAEKALHLSDRTARSLVSEAELFRDAASLAEAYRTGRIGAGQARLIDRAGRPAPAGRAPLIDRAGLPQIAGLAARRASSGRTPEQRQQAAWRRWRKAFRKGLPRIPRSKSSRPEIEPGLSEAHLNRASRVTVRQFQAEVRFLERLKTFEPALWARFRGPLPAPGLEEALVQEMCRQGWTEEDVRGLTGKVSDSGEQGQAGSDPMEDLEVDPAASHDVMRRLEILLEQLVLARRKAALSDGVMVAPSGGALAGPAVGATGGPAGDGTTGPAVGALVGPARDGTTGPTGGAMVAPSSDNAAAPEPGSAQTVRQTSAPPGGPGDSPTRIRIRFWLPENVAAHWYGALDVIREEKGRLPTYALVVFLLERAIRVWQAMDPASRPAEERVLKRDRYRCQVPGCTSRRVEVHHIVFRSRGGTNRVTNRVCLCPVHHRHGIHGGGYIRLTGEAPHALGWELGVRRDGSCLWKLRGDRYVT